MKNLRTAFIHDNCLNIVTGWFVNHVNNEILCDLIPDAVSDSHADLRETPTNPCFLMSGKLEENFAEVEVEPEEDSIFPSTKKVPVRFVTLHTEPSDKIFYRFILPEDSHISLSKDFTVLLEGRFENAYHSERYDRMIYATLNRSEDVPLMLDAQNTICVSPL